MFSTQDRTQTKAGTLSGWDLQDKHFRNGFTLSVILFRVVEVFGNVTQYSSFTKYWIRFREPYQGIFKTFFDSNTKTFNFCMGGEKKNGWERGNIFLGGGDYQKLLVGGFFFKLGHPPQTQSWLLFSDFQNCQNPNLTSTQGWVWPTHPTHPPQKLNVTNISAVFWPDFDETLKVGSCEH